MESHGNYKRFVALFIMFLFVTSVILYDQGRNEYGSEYDPVLLPESPEKLSIERNKYKNLLCQLDKSRVENLKSLETVAGWSPSRQVSGLIREMAETLSPLSNTPPP